METETVSVGDFILKSKLGRGSYSTVWKAQHKISGQVVAVKQVYLSGLNRHLRNCLECELNFLLSVSHPNIIGLFNVLQDKDCMFLVLEYCGGGDLASYIHVNGRVKQEVAKKFMQQLGAGLKVLNSYHIIHRDLKPENILLSCIQGDMAIKIADFGLSRRVCDGEYAETACGSPLYMAPEVIQFQRYDEKVDMWSVGAILFELLNGYPPFNGRTNVQVLRSIKSSTFLPFSGQILSGLHPDCLDMCLKLLTLNPVHRLSFDEFYRHKFLR